MAAICLGLSFESKWSRRISLVCRIGNLFSGKMFSLATGKHPPWITSATFSYACPVVTNSVRCGPPFRQVGHDSVTNQNPDRFPTESMDHIKRNPGPLPLESPDH